MNYLEAIGWATLALIFIITATSWKGFRDRAFKDRFVFEVDSILRHREYYRLITSGFLHTNWLHLLLNITVLLSFGPLLEESVGLVPMLIIYFFSLIGGDLFALYVHRKHSDYSALGASGGVAGLIFSCIVLDPQIHLSLLGLPLPIPAWLFGITYILISIYGIRSKTDNIGHESHLAGGITGVLVTLFIEPSAIKYHYIAITLILTPAVVFIYLIFTRATFLMIDHHFTQAGDRSIDDQYNSRRIEEEKEIDAILDKINQKGLKSLTRKERERLERQAKDSDKVDF